MRCHVSLHYISNITQKIRPHMLQLRPGQISRFPSPHGIVVIVSFPVTRLSSHYFREINDTIEPTRFLILQIFCPEFGFLLINKKNTDSKTMGAGEEGSPLLPKQEESGKEENIPKQEEGAEWTVDGLPLGHGNVVGAPVSRSQWDSSLFACLGRNDEFCSSDLEVCLLGTVAPCMLYGSNVERLSLAPGTFANHCLPYTSLYLLGNFLFGWNCLAPWFSYPSRTAIRRKFNLEGSCEAFSRSCGCCGGIMEDDEQREHCESSCDFATHFFCHRCALCQEGRELRRRLPHPGFNGRSVLVMLPPVEQMMAREA